MGDVKQFPMAGELPVPGPGQAVIDGKYEVIERLGLGSSKLTFLVRHKELQGMRVLKFFLPSHLRHDSRLTLHYGMDTEQQFRSEGRALETISHPNVVQIHDLGVDELKRFFIIEEYFGDGTLGSLLEDGWIQWLPFHQKVSLLEQMAAALGAVHEAGYIHRDAHPGNFLVDRRNLHVKLTDLGLAVLRTKALPSVTGSLLYSSPEQLQGTGVGFSSDLIPWGAIAFQIFTNRHPLLLPDTHESRDQQKEKLLELYRQPHFLGNLEEELLERLPGRLSRLLDPYPRHFASTIIQCLEEDPLNRFRDGQALSAALDAHKQRAARRKGLYRKGLTVAAATLLGGSILFGGHHLEERYRIVGSVIDRIDDRFFFGKEVRERLAPLEERVLGYQLRLNARSGADGSPADARFERDLGSTGTAIALEMIKEKFIPATSNGMVGSGQCAWAIADGTLHFYIPVNTSESGFLPGAVWAAYYLARETNDDTAAELLSLARRATDHVAVTILKENSLDVDTSLGRRALYSDGFGFAITGDPRYARVVNEAAALLGSRFDPRGFFLTRGEGKSLENQIFAENLTHCVPLLIDSYRITQEEQLFERIFSSIGSTVRYTMTDTGVLRGAEIDYDRQVRTSPIPMRGRRVFTLESVNVANTLLQAASLLEDPTMARRAGEFLIPYSGDPAAADARAYLVSAAERIMESYLNELPHDRQTRWIPLDEPRTESPLNTAAASAATRTFLHLAALTGDEGYRKMAFLTYYEILDAFLSTERSYEGMVLHASPVRRINEAHITYVNGASMEGDMDFLIATIAVREANEKERNGLDLLTHGF